jgi:hypothetical protein
MLANGTTIIYWNPRDGEKVTGRKGLSDEFQIVVIFCRPEVRCRPSLAALFSQTAARRRSACLPSAAAHIGKKKVGKGCPERSKGYPVE